MKKKITISIPNACSQKWENFSYTEEGASCCSCTKTVVDFTAMNDVEIVQFFEKKQGPICGRFRNNQLKSYNALPVSKINPGFILLKAGLLCLVLALTANSTFGQVKPNAAETVQTLNTPVATSEGKGYRIKGIIKLSDDGSVLPGVNIYLKNDVSVGTVSDENGQFEFPKKLKEGEVLLFSFIGMETQEYRVLAVAGGDSDIKLNINMVMTSLTTLGEVAFDAPYSEPNGMVRVWRKLKSIF